MLSDNSKSEFSFSKPAVYRIKVLGEVSKQWSERLRGMNITIERKKGEKAVSILTGIIPDQAALSGILQSLHEMHLSILSVKKLKKKIPK